MKQSLKISLYTLSFLIFFSGIGGLLVLTAGDEHEVACNNISIKINGPHHFISEEDVTKSIKRNHSMIIGERLSDIDLFSLESTLKLNQAISDAQAWTTKDGTLHIKIIQREPVLKILDAHGEGYYSDENGIVFPLSKHYDADVPVIRCSKSKAMDQEWFVNALSLVKLLSGKEKWNERIVSYSVLGNEDFVLHGEKEKIILGDFSDIDRKLRYLDGYFTKIKPLGNEYKIVNLKYKGQIICRKKDI